MLSDKQCNILTMFLVLLIPLAILYCVLPNPMQIVELMWARMWPNIEGLLLLSMCGMIAIVEWVRERVVIPE